MYPGSVIIGDSFIVQSLVSLHSDLSRQGSLRSINTLYCFELLCTFFHALCALPTPSLSKPSSRGLSPLTFLTDLKTRERDFYLAHSVTAYTPLLQVYCSPDQVSFLINLVTQVMFRDEGIMRELLLNDEEDVMEEGAIDDGNERDAARLEAS